MPSDLEVENGLIIDNANGNTGVLKDKVPFPGLRFGGIGSGEGIGSARNSEQPGAKNVFGLDFYTSYLPRLCISNTGNVGIGTMAPSSKLCVEAHTERQISASSWADMSANSGGWGYFAGNAYTTYEYDEKYHFRYANNHDLIGAIGFAVNYPDYNTASVVSSGTTSATAGGEFTPQLIAIFTSDGKVGIGTRSPHAKLEVDGDIHVTGDVVLENADCAEDFNIADAETAEPGTVMVIDGIGGLRASRQAYDKRVAGVISGAGDLRPGITLDKQPGSESRLPVALVGKVNCKVDASYGPIEVGDLLTTSPTPGCAMKADDPNRAFGSVIGKSLGTLSKGQGLIPILIALQ